MDDFREHFQALIVALCEGARLGRFEIDFQLRGGRHVLGIPDTVAGEIVVVDNRTFPLSEIDKAEIAGPDGVRP